jgi:hypothetical protein
MVTRPVADDKLKTNENVGPEEPARRTIKHRRNQNFGQIQR